MKFFKLKPANNKKIFKGDIVSYNQSNCSDEDMKLFKLKPAKEEIRYCPKNECFFVMGWLGVSLKDMRSLKVVPCKKL